MTDFEITDDLLKQLVQEWGETLPYRYPLKMETPPELSQQFLDKMELLFIKAEKMEKQAKYIALRTAAAILAAALATTVAMAYAVRYFKMVREKHEKYSAIYYEQVEDGFSSDEFICYQITYIPEGFVRSQSRKTEISYQEKFQNNDNVVIVFNQTKIDGSSFLLIQNFLNPKKSPLAKPRLLFLWIMKAAKQFIGILTIISFAFLVILGKKLWLKLLNPYLQNSAIS